MERIRRLRRDARIVQLYEDGIGCPRIAKLVGLNPPRVRSILKAKGYDLGDHYRASASPRPTMWERDGFDLRAAIANRARAGARQRIKEIGAGGEPSCDVFHAKIDSAQLGANKSLGALETSAEAAHRDPANARLMH